MIDIKLKLIENLRTQLLNKYDKNDVKYTIATEKVIIGRYDKSEDYTIVVYRSGTKKRNTPDDINSSAKVL